MLLTLSTTHDPATDLGHLLHKHPSRVQQFSQWFGQAHVFYPETEPERCTVALLVEVDPIGLVRGRRRTQTPDDFALGHYVNARPYAASSLLAIAMKDVFSSAMAGRCQSRPELAATPIPLEITVPAVPARGGAEVVHRLFGPLGWAVETDAVALDPAVPDWGNSSFVDLRLTGRMRVADALNQLYVLLPALDGSKHYWVGEDEVDKLLRAGAGWLADHPDRELVAGRYLDHRSALTRSALDRLAALDEAVEELHLDPPDEVVTLTAAEPAGEATAPLHQQRRTAVLAALRAAGARRVADLGCGEGALVAELLADPGIELVVATDVSVRSLQILARRLQLDAMSERQRARLQVFQSSLVYGDDRLAGLDAAVLMEVIEHVDPPRLAALEEAVFGVAAPRTVLVTTPNVEHNTLFPALPAGTARHRDHRFEWTRAEFGSWAQGVADRRGYTVAHLPIGPDDPDLGPPTQLAVFTAGVWVGVTS